MWVEITPDKINTEQKVKMLWNNGEEASGFTVANMEKCSRFEINSCTSHGSGECYHMKLRYGSGPSDFWCSMKSRRFFIIGKDCRINKIMEI